MSFIPGTLSQMMAGQYMATTGGLNIKRDESLPAVHNPQLHNPNGNFINTLYIPPNHMDTSPLMPQVLPDPPRYQPDPPPIFMHRDERVAPINDYHQRDRWETEQEPNFIKWLKPDPIPGPY